MFKRSVLILLSAFAAPAAFSGVILQEDFTSAQNGTLPATLVGKYDPLTDTTVRPHASQIPVPVGDHAGGDGYACRVGDVGTGGGAFQYVYQATGAAQAGCRLSAWVYVDLTNNMNATPLGRSYFLMLRSQARDPGAGTLRNGYMFAITRASTDFAPITPADRRPFLSKRVGTTYSSVGAQAAAPVADGWHLLAIEAIGTTIKGFVDGAEVCQATDASFATGYPALCYCERNGATTYPAAGTYDNFLYETAAAASASDWALY